MWEGFFKPDKTGPWTFYINSNDHSSYLWIGEQSTAYLPSNAFINNSGSHGTIAKSRNINLIIGSYYFIRIIYGNTNGSYNMIFSFKRPYIDGIITDGTNFFWYDTGILVSYNPSDSNTINGLRFTIYNNYLIESWDNQFFSNVTILNDSSTNITTSISDISVGTNNIVPLNDAWDNHSIMWEGLFKPDTTGIWTFYINSKDCSCLWIGNIYQKYLPNNAFIYNCGIHRMQEITKSISLTANVYYYIRIIYGNNSSSNNMGSYNMIFSFIKPNTRLKLCDGSNLFYYNTNILISYMVSNKVPIKGLKFIIYNDYINESNTNAFFSNSSTITIPNTGITTSISDLRIGTSNMAPPKDPWNNRTIMWEGLFKPDTDGEWTFLINSKDSSYVWINNQNRYQQYLPNNALINNGGVHAVDKLNASIILSANIFYYIRIIYSNSTTTYNNSSKYNMSFSFIKPNTTEEIYKFIKSDGTSYFYLL